MSWRRVVGGIGRTLIGAGILLVLFVAYQLWGTALAERRAQDALEQEFTQLLAQATSSTSPPATSSPTTLPSTSAPSTPSTSVPGTPTTTTISSTTTAAAPSTTAPPPPTRPFLAEGDAVARLEIPSIGVDKIVVAGVSVGELRRGPGHYPTTPLPGQLGNAAIAGHRTTYGAPFSRIDELHPGDEILVTTTAGRFRYLVTGQRVVAPTELSVLDPTATATLTLTACHPRYSARQRLVVTAALEPDPVVAPVIPTGPAYVTDSTTTPDPGSAGVTSPASGGTLPDDGGPAGPTTTMVATPGTVVGTTVAGGTAADIPADALTPGWFSEPDAWFPTVAWALACALVAIGAWWAGRRWRRWPSYLLATPLFLVVLYVCFGQLTRLMPPNL